MITTPPAPIAQEDAHIHPWRDAILAGFVVLLITAFCSTLLYRYAQTGLLNQVQATLLNMARTAAVLTDGDLHQTLKDNEQKGGADYLRVQQPYRQILGANPTVRYIYSFIEQDGKVFFIIDTQQEEKTEPSAGQTRHETAEIMEEYTDISPAMALALQTKKEQAENEIASDEWGQFMSAYAPFYNSKGEYIGLVGIDMDATDFAERMNSIRLPYIASLLLALAMSLSVVLAVHRIRVGNLLRWESRKQKIEVLKMFMANFSHELRTPLNAIIGFSEMLKNEFSLLPDSTRHMGYLQDINNSGQHLLSPINDILDISKAEAGKLEFNVEEFNFPKLARGCIDLVRPDTIAAKITISERFLNEDLLVRGDRKRLRQIMLNLLSNAIKFTPSGGRISVTVQSDDPNTYTVLVSDTGIGISAEDMSRVLIPFEQVDSETSRRHIGTGLGLPFSKKLVEMMGGTFRMESALNKGTTVSFSLPLRPHTKPE